MSDTQNAAGAEIWFYQLLHQPLEKALPKLLEKTRERGWKAVVEIHDAERLKVIDDALWTQGEESFLAHGTAADGDGALQPIYLATDSENPNGADIRIYAGGAPINVEALRSTPGYKRVALIFDGTDDLALQNARSQWKDLRQLGLAMKYHEQRENGGWEQKFEQAAKQV